LVGFGEFYVTMVLAVISGMLLGMLSSALTPNAGSAPLILIAMMIPLIVLSGALAPVPTNVSQIASTRWTFQSLYGIAGVGSDVAADPCWHLDKDLRDSMDLNAKSYFQCKCMGVQVFNQNSCSFPGVGDYYVAQIDQLAPIEPAALPPQPAEPVIPAAPAPPQDKYDQVQMVQYLNALSAYQDQVKDIQDNYRNQIDLYKIQADVYQSQMVKYQTDLATYTVARVSAVKAAEGTIKAISDKFNWAFVNKKDPAIFYPWLFDTWMAQVVIFAVYFVIILILIKGKDVK